MGTKRIVRIDCDGTADQSIITLEDGTILSHVYKAEILLEPNAWVQVNLTILNLPIHVEGEVGTVMVVCPICGIEVKHICDPPQDNSRI